MSKKDLLAKGLENLGNMINNAESVRATETEKTEQSDERRTVVTEANSALNKKIDRTANGYKKPVNIQKDYDGNLPKPPIDLALTDIVSDLDTKALAPVKATNKPQETPNTDESSEHTLSERERVKANLAKNPTGLKRPVYALKGRAKTARTYREAFQMTADLGEKLDNYIKATNGNKSEFIRRAIARELGKTKDDM